MNLHSIGIDLGKTTFHRVGHVHVSHLSRKSTRFLGALGMRK